MKTIKPGDIAVGFMPRSPYITHKKSYVIVRITKCGYIGIRNDIGVIQPYCPDNFWFRKSPKKQRKLPGHNYRLNL